MNEAARIEEFEEKPMVAHSRTVSTGIYIMRRRLLIDLVEHSRMRGAMIWSVIF